MSIMELCTKTERVTQEAVHRGWKTFSPITIETGYDLTTPEGIKQGWEQLYKTRPDVVVIAWPCNPWSSWQHINLAKAEGDKARLEKILKVRRAHRKLTKFCSEVMKWQAARGAYFVCENPVQSEAWKLPEFSWLFSTTGVTTWVTDMCQYNLRDPVSGLYYRKATRLVSNVPSMESSMSDRCWESRFPHDHQVIMGSTRHENRSLARSVFAGWYTHEFCTRLLSALESHVW